MEEIISEFEKALQTDMLKSENKTKLIDNLGFSFKIDLPSDYKQKLDPKNEYSLFSLIYLQLDKKTIEENNTDLIPINTKLSLCEEDKSGILEAYSSMYNDSVNIKNFIRKGPYYFNIGSKKFEKEIKKKFEEIDVKKMITELYDEHLNRNAKAEWHFRIEWFKKAIFLFAILLRYIFSLFYLITTGNKIKFSISMFGNTSIRKQIISNDEIKKIRINFFNFDINIIPITTYSMIHMIGYLIFSYISFKPTIYTTILKNNFLVVIYTIVTLVIMQFVFGNIFKGISILFSFIANKNRNV
jgi:hypothetical protein